MLVASLIEWLKVDFGQIIDDAIFIHAQKMANVLPSICLIIELCRQANIPIIRRVDNKIQIIRKQDIVRTKMTQN